MNTINQTAFEKVQNYRRAITTIDNDHSVARMQAMAELKKDPKVMEMLRGGLNTDQIFEVLQHATA